MTNRSLRGGGLVAVGGPAAPSTGTTAAGVGVVRAAAAGEPGQLAGGDGGQQLPVVVGECEGQRSAVRGRCRPSAPNRASSSRSWPAVIASPLTSPPRAAARRRVQVGGDGHVGRAPAAARSRRGAGPAADSTSARSCPIGRSSPSALAIARQLVDHRVAGRGLARRSGPPPAWPCRRAGRVDPHVGGLLRLLLPCSIAAASSSASSSSARSRSRASDRSVASGSSRASTACASSGAVCCSASASTPARRSSISPGRSTANVAGSLSRQVNARRARNAAVPRPRLIACPPPGEELTHPGELRIGPPPRRRLARAPGCGSPSSGRSSASRRISSASRSASPRPVSLDAGQLAATCSSTASRQATSGAARVAPHPVDGHPSTTEVPASVCTSRS